MKANDECKCGYLKYFPLYKCDKCSVNNIINFENINEVMKILNKIELKRDRKCHIIINTYGGESSSDDSISRLLSVLDEVGLIFSSKNKISSLSAFSQ